MCGLRQNEGGTRKRKEASIGRNTEEIEEVEEGRLGLVALAATGALARGRLKGMGRRMVGKEESRNGVWRDEMRVVVLVN